MPNFRNYFSRASFSLGSDTSSPRHQHHNLQEGLFQIATHTCSLLVQVNNTNNISFGGGFPPSTPGETSFQTSSANVATSAALHTPSRSDEDQLMVLLPSKTGHKSAFTNLKQYTRRLSTVLEGGAPETDDLDLWHNQGYMLRDELDDERVTRWNKQIWCKPSCIPITIIMILIFLVVLLPLLDHTATEENRVINQIMHSYYSDCPATCKMSLVETIPEGLEYSNDSIQFPSTYQVWSDLIDVAKERIEIGSYYWSLRQDEVWPDESSKHGELIFRGLLEAGTERGIKIKIAQNVPMPETPNTDTEYLAKRKAAEVRSLNFAQILGGGILHTKLWVVDRKHFYVGSANFDWRALAQVKEVGAVFYNCSCLAEDIAKIFDVYWLLGDTPVIPDQWPDSLATVYNAETPMNLSLNDYNMNIHISSSPAPLSPNGRTSDLSAILNTIEAAEHFIYISVMDYFPLTIYTARTQYWPLIDDALRSAAVNSRVRVRLLISKWKHSRPMEDNFLNSLAALNNASRGVSIEIRRFIVPATDDQDKIPFARVNHNKYMVTDNTAYIGTSNWSGDYFISTAGIGLVISDPVLNRDKNEMTVRRQLQAIFERDWYSPYAHVF